MPLTKTDWILIILIPKRLGISHIHRENKVMSEIITAAFLKLKHGRTKFVCIDLCLSLPNVLTCEMRALLFYIQDACEDLLVSVKCPSVITN